MCIAQSHDQVERIVRQLQDIGFARGDISVLFPDKKGTRDFAYEHNTKAPEAALAGAGAGGLLGGAIGLLLGLGVLVIPGAGPFLVAGPILAAMSGVAGGAAVGSLAGGLIGLGIPEMEAKSYEGKVRGGNILISVHTETAVERERAQDLFKSFAAEDICTAAEATVPTSLEVSTVSSDAIGMRS
jgi:hypothetical protein